MIILWACLLYELSIEDITKILKEIEIFTETAQLNKRLRQTFAIGLPTILILFNMSTVAILLAPEGL